MRSARFCRSGWKVLMNTTDHRVSDQIIIKTMQGSLWLQNRCARLMDKVFFFIDMGHASMSNIC